MSDTAVCIRFCESPSCADSGVYMIRCTANKRFYVGSSKQITHRLQNHFSSLRKGHHHSAPLQRAWDKYGEDAFESFVLGHYPPEELQAEEQYWFDSASCDYNVSKTAYRVEHTPEVREKISIACRKAMTPERRARLSEAHKGKKYSRKPMDPDKRAALNKKLQDTHRAKNRKYEAFGRLWSLKEAAEHYDIHYGMLKDRVRAGWPLEEALTRPKRKGGL